LFTLGANLQQYYRAIRMSSQEIERIFGNRLRVRVMGLLVIEDQLLMVNHRNMNYENELWLPPGGGADFGTSVIQSLKQEFLEEVNLEVEVGRFLFAHEFMSLPFHAIELFFEIKDFTGKIKIGNDPELLGEQSIQSARFMTLNEIKSFLPKMTHTIFENITSIDELFQKRGFFYLANNP